MVPTLPGKQTMKIQKVQNNRTLRNRRLLECQSKSLQTSHAYITAHLHVWEQCRHFRRG